MVPPNVLFVFDVTFVAVIEISWPESSIQISHSPEPEADVGDSASSMDIF